MATLTLLPESVLITSKLSLHQPFTKTTHLGSSHCFKSHSPKHFSSLTSVSAFSRHSRTWCQDADVDHEWIGLSPQASTMNIVKSSSMRLDTLTQPELSTSHEESCKSIPGAMNNLNGSGYVDTYHDEITSKIDGVTFFNHESAATFWMSSHRWFKCPVLIGLLTLVDSQQAMAGSEFTAGLQSISYFGDLGDISTGFASAFLLIFFSELGDKTFFIAAILAARNSGTIIFIGTFGALAAMTVVSVVLGRAFHYVDGILPFRFGEADLPLDDIAAVCLLIYFGVSTLIEAASSDGLKTKEEQKEAELAVSEFSGDGAGLLAAASTVFSTFLVVFVAEWGDKSFFSTIALAAASSPLGVIGGALAGHAAATLLAVLGGSLLGTFLSEKAIAYVGGTLFLVFAAVTLFEIVT